MGQVINVLLPTDIALTVSQRALNCGPGTTVVSNIALWGWGGGG